MHNKYNELDKKNLEIWKGEKADVLIIFRWTCTWCQFCPHHDNTQERYNNY